jgi:hypothetical protein
MHQRRSGSNIQAAFTCKSLGITLEEITAILELEPTRYRRKGDQQQQSQHSQNARLTSRKTDRYAWNIWTLEFASLEVEALIERLLESFQAKQAGLAQLAALPDTELSTSIWWDLEDGYGGFSIRADTMAQFCALGERLDLYLPGLGGAYDLKESSHPELTSALNQAFKLDLDYLKWSWLTEALRYDLGMDQRRLADLLPSGHVIDQATGISLGLLRDYLPVYDDRCIDGIARLSLMITAPDLELDQLTEILTLAPTRSFLKGQRASQYDFELVRPWSLWAYEVVGLQVEELALELLRLFGAKQVLLQEIVTRYGADLSVGIWWEPPDGYGGFTISKEVLRDLCALGENIHVYLPGALFYKPEGED